MYYGIPPMLMIKRSPLILAPLLILLLTACWHQKPLLPLPDRIDDVPGILHSVELSLVRRGTHLLYVDNGKRYYVESALLNLRNFEGEEVLISGTLEENVDPAYWPLLRADKVERIVGLTRSWSVPHLRVSVEVPEEWKGKERGRELQFTLKDTEKPILTIFSESGSLLPDGVPIVVAGRRAVRILDDAVGSQEVHILLFGRLLTLLFTPSGNLPHEELRSDFVRMLQNITIEEEAKEKEETWEPSSFTGAIIPCDGAAGVLCPTGFYCEVVDLQENIGRCQRVRQ